MNDTRSPSIQCPSRRMIRAMAATLGKNVKVNSWIDVTAWKIAMINPTTRLAIRAGPASSAISVSACDPSVTTVVSVMA